MLFSYFPFVFEGRILVRIVSVPDHCLSVYFDPRVLNTDLFLSNSFDEPYRKDRTNDGGGVKR